MNGGLRVLISLGVFALAAIVTQSAQKVEAFDSSTHALLGLINAYRAEHGLGPLAFSDKLTEIAAWKVNDMALNDCFSHADSLSRDPFQRMTAMGWSRYTLRGENLAAAASTPEEVLYVWQGSPTHNAVLLEPRFELVGIAYVFVEGTEYGWYWAGEFASPAPTLPTPTAIPTPAPQIEPVEAVPARILPKPPSKTTPFL